MKKIQSLLDPRDGLACFNRLYQRTTENILATVERGGFADPGALARLDVVFANAYFSGISACLLTPQLAPRAWLPLMEARKKKLAPIQFALAGMNAHINRDLAPSLAEAFAASFPSKSSAEHGDYLKVNDVLATTEDEVKAWFEGELLAAVDEALGRVDDVCALWSVRKARDAAWTWGQTLFALRDHPTLAEDTLLALDRTAGLASRALLL